MKKINFILTIFFLLLSSSQLYSQSRRVSNFNNNWKFLLGDDPAAKNENFNDSKWRTLNLPHDWSIEGNFSEDHPTTFNEGALPAGVGWYRKTFNLPISSKDKLIYINFDGVYKNSEVWINGYYLGKRPNGYISFRYELTTHLKFGNEKNVITVKVDNSAQPDSRWYTGSGIYRKVWLLTTNKIAFDQWGVFVTTPRVSSSSAAVKILSNIFNATGTDQKVNVLTKIISKTEQVVATKLVKGVFLNEHTDLSTEIMVKNPTLWSITNPYLYKVVTKIMSGTKIIDEYTTQMGIRSFEFNAEEGFFLNGKHVKILGVCNHHDLGAMGAAVNIRAIERQLEILKAMGCNAIRTAHNPPATELLDLCDKMGFIVMDEGFDIWAKRKNKFDYHLEFEKWHKQDLVDIIKRDRNHPSVFIWSIGNEIREQFDSSGTRITKELVDIVKSLDTSRPVTSALTENVPEKNFITQSGALDILGFNYKLADYESLPKKFPGAKFFASETMSALATRGHYDMPSDSIRLWPPDSKFPFTGNADHTVSAYDNVYAYWGSTHEAGWNAVKKLKFMAGLFVWSGFDFLGEPVPYKWPSRSSYYGIIDLAGFPKDAYYMYQSEWTHKPMLHVFPHWNWERGQEVDIWAYYNNADEVELFINGKSQGVRKKSGDSLHVMWRVKFDPGVLKVISRKNNKIVLEREIKTAGKPARVRLTADRILINSNGDDLSYVIVEITDNEGNLVPDAENLVRFRIKGRGSLAGVDNGLQTSMEPFHSDQRRAYNGKCLVIIRAGSTPDKLELEAFSTGLRPAKLAIVTR